MRPGMASVFIAAGETKRMAVETTNITLTFGGEKIFLLNFK